MARARESFVDQHIEKVVLGVCAIVFLGLVGYAFSGRFSISEMGPSELIADAAQAAENTANAVRNAKPKPPEKGPVAVGPAEQLKRWFGDAAEGLAAIAKVEPRFKRTQPVPPEVLPVFGTAPEDRHGLAKLTAPGIPVVMSGQTTFEMQVDLPFLEGAGVLVKDAAVRDSKRTWVSVGAQVDLFEQDINFRTAKYPAEARLTIVAIQLQRKDLTSGGDWEDVDIYLPFVPPSRPEVSAGGKVVRDEWIAYREVIGAGCEFICRPGLPARKQGDRAELPPLPYLKASPIDLSGMSAAERNKEINSRVNQWLTDARRAWEGKSPFKEPDPDAALVLARAAAASGSSDSKLIDKAEQLIQQVMAKLPRDRKSQAGAAPRALDRLMPIVAHDLDAQPGHTYQYRVRYEVLNSYFGNPGELNDPAGARRMTVLSDWSPPSRPVKIEGDLYYFLSKADAAKREATVTVFRKTRSGTVQTDYRVQVGEMIGRKERRGRFRGIDFTTGVLCVDIDFDRQAGGKKDVALVVLDSQDNRLKERSLSRDKSDKVRKELEKATEARTAGP